jgi:site-specific DNA-methyltransferase (adenine-specific)
MLKSDVHLIDCVEFMRGLPDKAYSLALVDPPYGINGSAEIGLGDTKSGRVNRPSKWGQKDWDKERPTKNYFEELKRISKNQIIFGGNYFADLLSPSRCWIVWDKMQRVNQADAELAWTSFNNSVRVYQYHCSQLQGFQNPHRFHPTEKPIALYRWLLRNYAKPNDTIFDSHMGSQSSRIACHMEGFDFTGCELDPEYFEQGNERYNTFLKTYGTPDPTKAIQGQQINLF